MFSEKGKGSLLEKGGPLPFHLSRANEYFAREKKRIIRHGGGGTAALVYLTGLREEEPTSPCQMSTLGRGRKNGAALNRLQEELDVQKKKKDRSLHLPFLSSLLLFSSRSERERGGKGQGSL